MHKIRYIMIGGFLGAGKTTTLGQLGRRFTEQGLNVGIVTNDLLVHTWDLARSIGADETLPPDAVEASLAPSLDFLRVSERVAVP